VLETIHAVDERFAETVAGGLYELQYESRFIVADSFDPQPECLQTVSDWRGTRVPPEVSQRFAAVTSPVRVEQEVRLRLLRRST
jgi:hypothetical protein